MTIIMLDPTCARDEYKMLLKALAPPAALRKSPTTIMLYDPYLAKWFLTDLKLLKTEFGMLALGIEDGDRFDLSPFYERDARGDLRVLTRGRKATGYF